MDMNPMLFWFGLLMFMLSSNQLRYPLRRRWLWIEDCGVNESIIVLFIHAKIGVLGVYIAIESC